MRGKVADAAVLPGADAVLDPGIDPMGGVDVGGVSAPAPQADGARGRLSRRPADEGVVF
ncbi:MAG: hypothetical protein ACJ72I_01075 [Pseudonocardiaceae bacterium]